jgi:hypothetical protein
MTATSTATRPTTRDLTGQMMTDAARRMLPVIAGKLLAAAADRAVEGIEGLADRLEDLGTPAEDTDAADGDTDGDADAGGSGGRMSAVFAFLTEQTRIVLRFLARLAAQAAEMLRRATDRLRARRAPEGIDEAPAPEEISAPEDLDEDEYDDEYDDEVREERAPVGV